MGGADDYTMVFAFKLEKLKKNHDIGTYKEIIAFTEGKTLDEITKREEKAKNPYQRVMMALGSAVTAIIVCALMLHIFK